MLGLRGLSGVVLVAVMVLPCPLSWYAYGPPRPLINDEFDYLMGAKTFRMGRLFNPARDPEFFGAAFTPTSPAYAIKPGFPI